MNLLKKTVVLIEDVRFYEHHGIDLISILRALVANIRAGRYVQGGSTITQQLARMLHLTRERTLRRKIMEAFFALWLEIKYTKQEILDHYMAEVYLGQDSFGHEIRGFERASEHYFGKNCVDLSVGEVATLVAMLPGPNNIHSRDGTARQLAVLTKMLKAELINSQELFEAIAAIEYEPLRQA